MITNFRWRLNRVFVSLWRNTIHETTYLDNCFRQSTRGATCRGIFIKETRPFYLRRTEHFFLLFLLKFFLTVHRFYGGILHKAKIFFSIQYKSICCVNVIIYSSLCDNAERIIFLCLQKKTIFLARNNIGKD